MADEAFSLKNWASVTEARDRIAAELGTLWAAELRLLRHLCRGELDSVDVCFTPVKGFEETIERHPREYWQIGALTKLNFALSEELKLKLAVEDMAPRHEIEHRLEPLHPVAGARGQSAANDVGRSPEPVELGLEHPIGMVERLCSRDRVDQRFSIVSSRPALPVSMVSAMSVLGG